MRNRLTVDKHHVAFLDAVGGNHACGRLDLLQQLLVRDLALLVVQGRVIINGHLFAAAVQDVAIHGVVAGVKHPVLEPDVLLTRSRGLCENGGEGLVPVQVRREPAPVLVWVLERFLLDLDLLMIVHEGVAVGWRVERRGWVIGGK